MKLPGVAMLQNGRSDTNNQFATKVRPLERLNRNISRILQMGLQAPPIENFKGKWLKDRDASQMSNYSRQLDLMQLGGVQKRTAMYLIHGLDISQDDTSACAPINPLPTC